jgi:DhnA family fructose-bisphosphate aldolase class Ia
MSDYGKHIRLNRILRANKKKTLVVAFDHPAIFGPIPGTLNPAEQIRIFADNGADAVLMNLGMLRIAGGGMLNERAPALIIRLDWTTAWTAVSSGDALRSELVVRPEEALRYGADAVMTYLFVGTGDNEFEAREIKRNAEVARECEQLGIPLIVESLARGKNVQNPTSPEWIKLHTRIAVELGADVLKTEYTGDVETMREVIQVCPAPMLVLGGALKPISEAMDIVKGAVAAGAAGLVFGRNVFQSRDVAATLRELRSTLDQSSNQE